jgi:hypothetical protein
VRRHRSIGERLRSAKSPAAKQATVDAWVSDWRRDQEDAVRQLDAAIDMMDRVALRSAAGQLYEITTKRFDGLATVVRKLTETER